MSLQQIRLLNRKQMPPTKQYLGLVYTDASQRLQQDTHLANN